MPGGNKKVTHLNKPAAEAAGLFKYVWSFCYHQALKGYCHTKCILFLQWIILEDKKVACNNNVSNFLSFLIIYVMRRAICYPFYNLKNGKNTHGGMLLLVKSEAEACNFTKSNTLPWVFSRFLNFTNVTKLRKASHEVKWSYIYSYSICQICPTKESVSNHFIRNLSIPGSGDFV